MAGDGEVRVDLDAPGPVAGRAGGERQPLGDGRRLHARGPEHRAGVVALHVSLRVADQQAVGVHRGHPGVHVQLDPQRLQRLRGLLRQRRPEGGQRLGAAVEEQHPGVLRSDAAELGSQVAGGQLPDLPCQLDAGRSATDQREGEPPASLRVVSGGLGHLEGTEHPAPDGEGVGDRLHARRPPRELVVTEVGLPDARGHDQVVVRQRDPVAAGTRGDHPAPGDVDVLHLREQAPHVPVPVGAGHATAPRSAPRRGSPSRTGRAAAGRDGAPRGPRGSRATGTRRNALAANNPAKPPPTITTCGLVLVSMACAPESGQVTGSCQTSPSGSSASASFGPQLPRA